MKILGASFLRSSDHFTARAVSPANKRDTKSFAFPVEQPIDHSNGYPEWIVTSNIFLLSQYTVFSTLALESCVNMQPVVDSVTNRYRINGFPNSSSDNIGGFCRYCLIWPKVKLHQSFHQNFFPFFNKPNNGSQVKVNFEINCHEPNPPLKVCSMTSLH